VNDHQTLSLAPWVYGLDPVAVDDPTELYHEASRLYPSIVDPAVAGGPLLQRSAQLRASAARAVARRPGLPRVELPSALPLRGTLGETLGRRRSRRTYRSGSLSLEQLATLLDCAYGVTGHFEPTGQPLRSVPSGGALYPLELSVAASRVDGLEFALYHFDPLERALERVSALEDGALEGLTPYDSLVSQSAALVVVSAVFWRSRFKYGQRAYRFVVLEAGHLAQNFLLAAAALRLACVPLGGFYDRRVDELVGADGLHEASIYMLPVGLAP
jgi:SagB-type dehydrogenase family enzyme